MVELRPAGERGLLVQLGTAAEVLAVTRWVRAQSPPLAEVVPAVSTVLLVGSPASLTWYTAALSGAELAAGPAAALSGSGSGADASAADSTAESPDRVVELPVVYDGPDLGAVARRCGLTVPEVVQRHQAVEHGVAFFGFSPGQPFLTGLPTELQVPRWDSPRTRVPAYSVGIANQLTTVYPQSSPGGWNLIGRYVGRPLWDPVRQPPNRLEPGDRVVFTSS